MSSLNWYPLFDSKAEMEASLIKNRAGKRFVADKWVCLLYNDSGLYAFDEACPHQNYSLLGATSVENKIICPLHKFKFDLTSGQGHGLSLSCYSIKEQEGKYYIGFKNSNEL